MGTRDSMRNTVGQSKDLTIDSYFCSTTLPTDYVVAADMLHGFNKVR